MSKKVKAIGEIPLYRSVSIFLTTLLPVVINMQKDVKITIGYRILNDVYDTISLLKLCFEETNINNKFAYVSKMYQKLSVVDVHLKMLFDIKYIGIGISAKLMQQLGNIFVQTIGWKNKIQIDCAKQQTNSTDGFTV